MKTITNLFGQETLLPAVKQPSPAKVLKAQLKKYTKENTISDLKNLMALVASGEASPPPNLTKEQYLQIAGGVYDDRFLELSAQSAKRRKK